MASVTAYPALPSTFRAAVRAEFGRAARPPYEVPLVVLCNGLLVVVFWFSRFSDVMFSLHGALAFPVVLGSWMYADVPATNVVGSDGRRVLDALDDEPMLMRLLAAKSAVLWLMIGPGCVLIAVIIGIADGTPVSAMWTVIAIAIAPLGALAVSNWVGILWPYRPVTLSSRWRDRRDVRRQLRWLVLILAPYVVVPAAFVAVSLPAAAWWRIKTDGSVSRIPDGLFGQLAIIASLTSLAVWFAGRAVSRRLLRQRHNRLKAYLAARAEPVSSDVADHCGMTEQPRDADANRLSAESYARGEPVGWFETLYAEAAEGRAIVPWDRGTPNPQLAEWAAGLDGTGRTAMVVGCGLGRDSEFLASLGFRTTAFDLSATAIETAKRRHPDTTVSYQAANLLDLPQHYRGAFDLVVESYTMQSLPDPPRAEAIAAVATMVAPGGTLLVIAAAGDAEDPPGPPFPLTRREIDAFATDGVSLTELEDLIDESGVRRWRARFTRSGR